jgi:hypothetical protein
MKTTKKALAFGAVLFASAGLMAQEEEMGKCSSSFSGSMPNTFAAVDADENGVLSKEEVGKFAAGGQLDNLFARWDKDEDGTLDKEEYCMR